MGNNKKSKRHGGFYSTNPNLKFDDFAEEAETLSPNNQNLKVSVDKKQRKGKEVTIVAGFVGTETDLKDLGKFLKQKCGVGGTTKEGEVLIQGSHLNAVYQLLLDTGYNVKKSGGG